MQNLLDHPIDFVKYPSVCVYVLYVFVSVTIHISLIQILHTLTHYKGLMLVNSLVSTQLVKGSTLQIIHHKLVSKYCLYIFFINTTNIDVDNNVNVVDNTSHLFAVGTSGKGMPPRPTTISF